jgi:hypothetical protein
VRGVEQAGLGARVERALGLEAGDIVALARDAGNDGDAVVDRLDECLDDLDLLVLGEEGALAGVAEDDEALDALDGAEPRADALDGLVVDRAVLVEGLRVSEGK